MAEPLSPQPLQNLPANTGRSRLTGIGLILLALGCFTVLDTCAKWLVTLMPTPQVVWARYAGAFLLSLLVLNPWTTPGLTRTRRPLLQIARSTMLVVSTLLNFIALLYLQLDQTAALMFTMPFFVAVLAGPLLGEWIGWRRWAAILVGFSGVLVITRPGFGGIHPVAVLSLLGSIIYALYNVSTRVLASYDSTPTTLFYTALVGFIATSIPLPLYWVTPADAWVIAGMVTLGACGGVGHWFLITAHRYAPAAVLAPFIYFQIVTMTASGYFFFGDVPSGWTLAGVAIVIASGLYLLNRERKMHAEDSLKAQTGE